MKGSTRFTRRHFLSSSALAAAFAQAPITALAKRKAPPPTPWRNWSGALTANPKARFSPSTEAQLVDFMSSTTGAVRPVGSGHSFSPLVPTDGHLIVLDQLTGLLDHNARSKQATFGAGTMLASTGPLLEAENQGLMNLPDIDRQTLAGAIATATHGTGLDFKSLSGYVTELRLVTPSGEVLDLNEQNNADLFNAARVSVGALGVVTQVRMQNRDSYRLKIKNWVEPTRDVLDNFRSRALGYRHFEIFPLVHSDYSLVQGIEETNEPINNPPPSPEEEAALAQAMASWADVAPNKRRPMINALAEQIQPSEAVDVSYKILSNLRNNRFNEMEYSVPLEYGYDCLTEILQTIREESVDVVFPLEYRYVKRDNTWLGMSTGNEDHASISIHRMASEDYRPYFNLMEPIFWKYGGRPHWGKVHSLGALQLRGLYPRFREFEALRRKMDPQGRMLNPHLRELFIA